MSALPNSPHQAASPALRLAIVSETYPPEVNGVALTLFRFIQGLHQLGHPIQLIRPRQGKLDVAEMAPGFSEILTAGLPIPGYPDLKMGLPTKGMLLREWGRARPDLVHIVTEGPLGWSALQAATQLGIPVSSDFRTNFHRYSQHYGIGWLKGRIEAYLRHFHNRTRATFVPTELMRQDLEALGIRNLHVVARGVDTQLFNPGRRSEALRQSWGLAPGALAVLHVGRLAAEKNLGVLAKAFMAIRHRHPGARLVLVGDGPERKTLSSLVPDAVFAGTRHDADLGNHYASGDMFLFPSLSETFGNVTLEALSSGLPVVAYDYAAAAQHITPANGCLAAYGDGDDFVAKVVQMADLWAADGAAFARMGQCARETTEPLDWRCVVLAFEALLRHALMDGPAGEGLPTGRPGLCPPLPMTSP